MSISEEAIYSLWALAEQFAFSSQFPRAISSLEAICQANLHVPPVLIAKTRIRLAEILITNTSNINEAKFHLECALTAINGFESEVELKLQIFYLLSIVFEKQDLKKQLKDILQSGIQLSTNIPKWYFYFVNEFSQVLIEENSLDDAVNYLTVATTTAQSINDISTQTFFSLVLAQLFLKWKKYQQAQAYLTSAEQLISVFEKYVNSNPENDVLFAHMKSPLKSPNAKASHAQQTVLMLRIHLLILTEAYLLNLGEIKLANSKLDSLQNLVTSMRDVDYNSGFYSWMTSASVYAFTYLISAVNHRIIGNTQNAKEFIAKGIDLVNMVYQKEVVDKKGMVTPEKKKLITSLIKLKFVLLENSIYLNITLYNLDVAMQHIMEAKELFEMFGLQDRSGVFADAECILNLELALYAHAMCYNECALQHYSAALSNTHDFDKQCLILIHMCFLFLRSNDPNYYTDSKNYVAKANDIIAKNKQRFERHPNLVIQASSHLLEGFLLQSQHLYDEARNNFKMAMALANQPISHNQLTGLTLISLGETLLQQKMQLDPKEVENIETAFASALAISYRANNLTTVIHSLSSLSFFYQRLNVIDKMTYNQQYKQAKDEEFMQRVSVVPQEFVQFLHNYYPARPVQ
jgi:tetratricopeptide (TPR) repeat protein